MPKLLLADDSITIQRVIELTFSGEDVQVVAVSDGEEAIARIPAERPDIVLADIGMPKRSGYDVAAFVKGHPDLAHIPVLLLAGAFEPVDQARADQVKCDGVLVKPFEPQQVIARVRELVNGAASRMAAGPVPGTGTVPGTQDAGRRRDAAARTPEPRMPDSREAPPPARVVASRRIIEVPDPASSEPPDAGDSLDDYFDRLDAAFASLGTGAAAPPEPPVLEDLVDDTAVPTIDDLLGGVGPDAVPGDVPLPSGRIAAPPLEPAESTPALAPDPGRAAARVGVPAAAVDDAPREATRRDGGAHDDASGVRTSAENGRNVIADVFSALLAVEQGDPEAVGRLPGGHAPAPVTDEFVDEVTRRVLARLAPDAVTDVVQRIVSDVAERLVREEIARIRGNA